MSTPRTVKVTAAQALDIAAHAERQGRPDLAQQVYMRIGMAAATPAARCAALVLAASAHDRAAR